MLKKSLLATLVAAIPFLPVSALDHERVDAIRQEIEQRQIKQYLLSFENHLNMRGADPGTMAANSIVKALNAISLKYPTINDMHRLLVELIDSGYYEQPPMLLYSLGYSLERLKEYGFGSGRVSSWQFKHMSRYLPKSACGSAVENVYYTTINHPSKNYEFGFYLSAGPGFVDPKILKTKTIGEECH